MGKKMLIEVTENHKRDLTRLAKRRGLSLKATTAAVLDWALSAVKSGKATIHPAKVEEAE
jgi:hypothetical protein